MHAHLLALALLATAPASRDPGPTMVPDADTVRTDAGAMAWNVPLRITNPLPVGFYLDSLILEVESFDAGEKGAKSRRAVEAAVRVLPSIGAADSNVYVYLGPATCERGRLTFRLHAHSATGQTHDLKATVVADGGVLTDAYPSRVSTVKGRTVETIPAPAAGASENVPGIVLLADENRGARAQLQEIHRLTQRGYHVVALSQPGRGQSAGPADAGGPATMAAANAALDQLLAMPGLDRSRVVAWGVSQGAGAALLLAAQRREVAGVIAMSGSYDPWATARHVNDAARADWIAQAGRDSAAWRARSPIHAAANFRGHVLILHGEADPLAPSDGARAMVSVLERAGATVERRYFPGLGHTLTPRETTRPVTEFLRQTLGR